MTGVALRALEHYAYCPRQCALIHVDGVWLDSGHTVRGTAGHHRVDTGGQRQERGRTVTRSMELWHDDLDLHGRGDAVEFWPDGRIVPVEYKMGRRHGNAADLQLCAQALCLEYMFTTTIAEGALWFGATRRRETVEFTTGLRTDTIRTVEHVRALYEQRNLPTPPNDERCTSCQLLTHCMPDLVDHRRDVQSYLNNQVFRCGS